MAFNLAPSTPVKNTGVSFDLDLSLDTHIKHTSRSAFYHLCNFGKFIKSDGED